jgi:hypothetical protein
LYCETVIATELISATSEASVPETVKISLSDPSVYEITENVCESEPVELVKVIVLGVITAYVAVTVTVKGPGVM